MPRAVNAVASSSCLRPVDDLLDIRVIGQPRLTVLRCHDLTLEGFDLSTDRPLPVGASMAFEFTCHATDHAVVQRDALGYVSAWEFMGEATDTYQGVEHLVGCMNVGRRATAEARPFPPPRPRRLIAV